MKLLLLDDHHLFGQSLKCLLEDQAVVDLCDYVDGPQAFLDQVGRQNYDILLVDINLKADLTGFDLIRQLRDQSIQTPIVILTAYDLTNYQSLAFDLGVQAFIHKSVEIGDLMDRLIEVQKGRVLTAKPSMVDPLTPREIEILQKLVQGQSKKEAALELFISERTLYNHLASIYAKLGVNNLLEAYNQAMALGYIEPKL